MKKDTNEKVINENVVMEDIKAEVEKTNSRLIFSGVVLFMVLIGFGIRTCSKMPSTPEPSVECVKAGGQWVPEQYKEIGGYTKTISGYCSLNKEGNK
jgi:hypothetical protein